MKGLISRLLREKPSDVKESEIVSEEDGMRFLKHYNVTLEELKIQKDNVEDFDRVRGFRNLCARVAVSGTPYIEISGEFVSYKQLGHKVKGGEWTPGEAKTTEFKTYRHLQSL
ncbi:MAG TPA: hypothetical protein VI815_00225 [Candidatus Nanoarchaeia archaeon]|nr:hypothetical protein [Candidatus Nanoarchaeia archaeon]